MILQTRDFAFSFPSNISDIKYIPSAYKERERKNIHSLKLWEILNKFF